MRALIYIIDALSMLITFVFLLRFWLPWFGADFRNPIAQGLLQATSPLINPLRRIVPSIGRIDTATVLVLFLIQATTMLTYRCTVRWHTRHQDDPDRVAVKTYSAVATTIHVRHNHSHRAQLDCAAHVTILQRRYWQASPIPCCDRSDA